MALKLKNRKRIQKAWYLMALFDLQTRRFLNESLLKQEQNYNSLQQSADLINFFHPEHNVTATELYRDKSETANECIELKENFDKLFELATDLGHDNNSVKSFIHYCEYSPKMFWIKSHHLILESIFRSMTTYIIGKTSPKQFSEQMNFYKKIDPVVGDFKMMLKIIHLLEDEVNRIESTRVLRKLRK